MREFPSGSRRFETPLHCAGCGLEGTALWERNAPGEIFRPPFVAIGTSDGFYLRLNVRDTRMPLIVCTKCGSVHPDADRPAAHEPFPAPPDVRPAEPVYVQFGRS